MSTRAVIARALGAQGTEYSHWEGRYHHHTGYPQGLGKRLYDLAHELGVAPMLALLVDEHPAGWSNIFGCDMRATPVYRGLTDEYMAMSVEERIADDAAHGPQCYCHGGRHWEATLITNPGKDYDTEWCYAIDDSDDATGAMSIYRRSDSPARWVYVATVRLLSDDPEPDWSLLRDRGDALIGRTPIRLTRRPGVVGCYPIDQHGRSWASVSCPPTPCALCDALVTTGWSLGKSDAVICGRHARYEGE